MRRLRVLYLYFIAGFKSGFDGKILVGFMAGVLLTAGVFVACGAPVNRKIDNRIGCRCCSACHCTKCGVGR